MWVNLDGILVVVLGILVLFLLLSDVSKAPESAIVAFVLLQSLSIGFPRLLKVLNLDVFVAAEGMGIRKEIVLLNSRLEIF